MLSVSCVLAAALMTFVAARVVQFSYIGCFNDTSVRDLDGLADVNRMAGMTISPPGAVSRSSDQSREFCSSFCSIGGFPYFALQFSSQCFCGTSYGKYGAKPESECSANCTGNSSQKCGAAYHNSVFALTYPSEKYFSESPRSNLTVESTQQTFWIARTAEKTECIIFCELKSSECQAVIFSKPEQLCYLLRFVYPPANLTTVAGDYFSRG